MSITVPLEGFGGGGGGTSLNFDVKAYATESALLAATPKENTIGIITTTAISSWIFAAVEPAEPVEGMVWISTDTSSAVEFNALKKNGLQVYPIAAKQYVDGAWVSVTAMSYRDGTWVEWYPAGALFYDGNVFDDVTGGWSSNGYIYYGSSYVLDAPEVTDVITLQVSKPGHACIAGTQKAIDLTKWTTLHAYCESKNGSNLELVVTDSGRNTYSSYLVASASLYAESEAVIDVSALTGEYYIAVRTVGSTDAPSHKGIVSRIWLT